MMSTHDHPCRVSDLWQVGALRPCDPVRVFHVLVLCLCLHYLALNVGFWIAFATRARIRVCLKF